MNPPPHAFRAFCLMVGVFLVSASIINAQQGNLQFPPKPNNNLLNDCNFLSNGGLSTLLPKGAILHVPKNFQNRMQFQQGNRLVVWQKFYRENRAWVITHEVTRKQAQGLEPLNDDVIQKIKNAGFVAVATFKGRPIKVLPFKKPQEAEQQA